MGVVLQVTEDNMEPALNILNTMIVVAKREVYLSCDCHMTHVYRLLMSCDYHVIFLFFFLHIFSKIPTLSRISHLIDQLTHFF